MTDSTLIISKQIFLGYNVCKEDVTCILEGRCYFKCKSNDFKLKEKQRNLLIIALITNSDGKANTCFHENF
jgi:hypothetical protein